MSGSKDHTKAMMIAKTKLSEFLLNRMRAPDVSKETIEEYPGFFYSRSTERFEHPMLGPIEAKKTVITISWLEKRHEKHYKLSYIFPTH